MVLGAQTLEILEMAQRCVYGVVLVVGVIPEMWSLGIWLRAQTAKPMMLRVFASLHHLANRLIFCSAISASRQIHANQPTVNQQHTNI